MKYISLLVLLFVCNGLVGQEVRHYQKKIELDQILMPYEKYNAELFMIKFSDSLYSNAEITIKKARVNDIKAQCYILVENNEYSVNSIQVKGKKKFERLKNKIAQELGVELVNLEPGDHCYLIRGNAIKLRYQDLGRKKVLTLIRSECTP